jgi:hypothetical protein
MKKKRKRRKLRIGEGREKYIGGKTWSVHTCKFAKFDRVHRVVKAPSRVLNSGLGLIAAGVTVCQKAPDPLLDPIFVMTTRMRKGHSFKSRLGELVTRAEAG